MTDAALRPAHDRLTAIPADRAVRQSTLIEALNNRLAGDLRLRAVLSDRRDAPAWIALGDLYLAPLLADGALPVLSDAHGRPDAAAAAVALAALEPVVAAIELVIGRPLLPDSVVVSPGDATTIVMVEALAAGRPLHRLLLASSDLLAIEPAAELPLDPDAIARVATGWTARIAGPALRRERVDDMGIGDLLLLGAGAPIARLSPPGRNAVLGCRLDLQGGMMTVEQVFEGSGSATDPGAPSAGDTDTGAALAEATVPITVEFDGGGLTLERLSALGHGSVVAVPAAGGVLPVRLRAGGDVIADGELVAVGDGFGVLVTAVAKRSAPGA